MLRLSPLPAIALACVVAVHTTSIAAPGIWRCGSSYSDTPCEGGRHIGTQAPPSTEERRQRDDSTRSDQATAERLQRERLEFEARPRQAVVIGPSTHEAPKARLPASILKPDKKKKGAKPKKPDGFVATFTDPAAQPAAGRKKSKQ